MSDLRGLMQFSKPVIFFLLLPLFISACALSQPHEPFYYISLDMEGKTFDCQDLQQSLVAHAQLHFISDYERLSDYRFKVCRSFIDAQNTDRCKNVALQVTLPINHLRLIGWDAHEAQCADQLDSIVRSMDDGVDFVLVKGRGAVKINDRHFFIDEIKTVKKPMPGNYTIPTWHVYFSYGNDVFVINSLSEKKAEKVFTGILEQQGRVHASL